MTSSDSCSRRASSAPAASATSPSADVTVCASSAASTHAAGTWTTTSGSSDERSPSVGSAVGVARGEVSSASSESPSANRAADSPAPTRKVNAGSSQVQTLRPSSALLGSLTGSGLGSVTAGLLLARMDSSVLPHRNESTPGRM